VPLLAIACSAVLFISEYNPSLLKNVPAADSCGAGRQSSDVFSAIAAGHFVFGAGHHVRGGVTRRVVRAFVWAVLILGVEVPAT
jgi:hypothetical protein